MTTKLEVTLLQGTTEGLCYVVIGKIGVVSRGLDSTAQWAIKLNKLSKEGDKNDGATAAVHPES